MAWYNLKEQLCNLIYDENKWEVMPWTGNLANFHECEFMDFGREPITTNLLNQHSFQLYYKCLFLCMQMNLVLIPINETSLYGTETVKEKSQPNNL